MTSSEPSASATEEAQPSTTSTMTTSTPVAAKTESRRASVAPPAIHYSKATVRTLERNSDMLYLLTQNCKGTQASRLCLASNELLREIVEGKIDRKTVEQLEFYVKSNRLKEDSAESVVFLAQSILAMGRSIGGFEDTVGRPPALRVKPPLDFGDDEDDGMQSSFVAPSGTAERRRQHMRQLHNDSIAADDHLNTSDNTETSVDTAEKEKPVGAENDYCVRLGAVHKFRPLTPDGEIREPRVFTPSPPPSPAFRELLKRRRRERKDRDEEDSEMEDEEEDTFYEDDGLTPPLAPDTMTTSSSVEKEELKCQMCGTVFYSEHQLTTHLVEYHRMRPQSSYDAYDEQRPAVSASSVRRNSTHRLQVHPQNGHAQRPNGSSSSSSAPRVGGSAAIVSTRPLNGFGVSSQSQRREGGGTAQVRPLEHVRQTSTTVISPGGTVRHYSSPSNAARAAAKAAAAAAQGLYRPVVPSKPYTCRQCGVVLTSQQMYASHVRYNHPKEKGEGGPPAPRQRSAADRNKETAIVHLQLDDGTKAFKCRRCDKVFDSAQKVAGHSRHCLLVFEGRARPANQGPVPTEDRPYTVYRCGLNSELARTCPYCGELLPSIRKVDKHVRLVHEASRHEVYGCSTCDRRFVTLGGIENHWLHYGDCPQGVLTVHKDDGTVTCADIGEIPHPLKRPKTVLQAAAAKRSRLDEPEESEDKSISIVNAILSAHGYPVKGRGAPDLSPEMDETMEEGEDDEEAAPDLMEEYGEGDDDELLNGDSHLDEEMDDDDDQDTTMGIVGLMKLPKGEPKAEKIIVSMKVIKCRLCNFAARTNDAMESHMNEHHPDDVHEEDEAPVSPKKAHLKVKKEEPVEEDEEETSVSPELNGARNGSSSLKRLKEEDLSDAETQQTGEMRRMLGIKSE